MAGKVPKPPVWNLWAWYQRLSKDLFFIKRRPHLFPIERDWERPANDEDYQKLLNEHGFVSPAHWAGDNINDFPIIKQDLRDLDEYLLETYFDFSQKSKFYQDRFYFYQWIFIFGAFLTTVLGSLATVAYDPSDNSRQQLFSYATAAVGAVTAFFTAQSNRGEPQKRWGKTRRLTEELRMVYFKYLSHLEPYDNPDRVQRLREAVIDCRVKEQEHG